MEGEIKKVGIYTISAVLTERQYNTLLAGLKMAKEKIVTSGLDMPEEDQELFNLFLKEDG